jgi:hypothetical protein
MPSPRTSERRGGGRPRGVGALPRAHPHGVRPRRGHQYHRLALALVSLVFTIGAASAHPLALRSGRHICPDGVLPLRLATFQPAPGGSDNVREAIDLAEFALSHAELRPRRGEGPITIAVLVYAGSRAEALEVEIATDRGVVTWRTQVTLEPPDRGLLTFAMHPLYVLIPLPEHEWHVAFPRDGPYTIRARRPFGHHTYPDSFCQAEVSSWALIVR